jgi:hypothetical protein
VIGDPEAPGLPDAAGEPNQHVRLEEAPLEILDVPAATADQMVMVRRERLGKLVATLPLGRVRRADEPDLAEKVHRPVDGHEVDALDAERAVELRHRARLLTGREGVEHRAAWRGDAVPAARQQLGDRVARILGDTGRGDVNAHCAACAGGSTPTAR